jgi:hypothetical protein
VSRLVPAPQPGDRRAMRNPRVDRLFHSLVVLGAALGAGCGARSQMLPGDPPAGADGGGGAGGSSTATATVGAGGTTASSGAGGFTTTTGTEINDPSDCEHSSQYTCDLGPDGGICKCDPSLPTGPQDCLTTADFHCQGYDPEYVTCYCDPSSPDKPEDCPNADFFYCDIDSPPTGCYCLVPIA